MDIKLSICIPTYNRADFLAATLESILPQVTEDIEVVVSDNASTDHTAAVVQSFQERLPHLVYFRQPANQGRDRNYLQAVRSAQGEYCWLLGDDDLLEEYAVSTLLNSHLTAKLSPDFVLLTGTVYDSHMKNILAYSADQIGVKEDIYTTDVPWFFQTFFRESGLSVFVIRREKWMAVDPGKYLGTGLVYLAIVYEYLKLDSPVQVVARSSIKYRSGNASWSQDTLDILIGHMNSVLANLPANYEPFKSEALRRYQQRVPITLKMLAALRSQKYYNLSLYRKYMQDYFRDDCKRSVLAYLIAVMPAFVMKSLQTIYRSRKMVQD